MISGLLYIYPNLSVSLGILVTNMFPGIYHQMLPNHKTRTSHSELMDEIPPGRYTNLSCICILSPGQSSGLE